MVAEAEAETAAKTTTVEIYFEVTYTHAREEYETYLVMVGDDVHCLT